MFTILYAQRILTWIIVFFLKEYHKSESIVRIFKTLNTFFVLLIEIYIYHNNSDLYSIFLNHNLYYTIFVPLPNQNVHQIYTLFANKKQRFGFCIWCLFWCFEVDGCLLKSSQKSIITRFSSSNISKNHDAKFALNIMPICLK